jgi:hypothetical protein
MRFDNILYLQIKGEKMKDLIIAIVFFTVVLGAAAIYNNYHPATQEYKIHE